jgi:hypothetical protein
MQDQEHFRKRAEVDRSIRPPPASHSSNFIRDTGNVVSTSDQSGIFQPPQVILFYMNIMIIII